MLPGALLLGWPKTWLLPPSSEFSIVCTAVSSDDDDGEEEGACRDMKVLVTFNVEGQWCSDERSCLRICWCVRCPAAYQQARLHALWCFGTLMLGDLEE